MKRAMLPAALMVAVLVTPGTALSQREPEKTKEVKEAERFVASAMLAPDTLEKRSRLQRALNPLTQGAAKTPDNALVWLLSGQVYAGLHDYARADTAFTKALRLHPAYAADIENERLRAWADLFNAGNAAMDAQRYDDAIVHLETAEAMYAKRPESKINLGALYANKRDAVRAEAFFRAAMEGTNEASRKGLKEEDANVFKRLYEMSVINVARIVGDRGIAAFEAGKYDDAAAAFREAYELNPHARDFSYNLAQSLYAKATQAEKDYGNLVDEEKAARTKKDAATASAKVEQAKLLSADIIKYYTAIEPLVAATRSLDPNNEDLYRVLMRSYRTRGDLTSDATQKADFLKRSQVLLREHALLDAEITDISVLTGGGQATVKGKLRNMKLTPGTVVKIHMMLLGLDGRSIGDSHVDVTAPAADQSADFQTVITTTGDIAGWKYEIMK